MIDLHCHILPNVDDGSETEESSLEMAAMAVSSEVTDIIATPHCNVPMEECLWAEDMRKAVARMNRLLEEKQIPLKLHPGMEIFGTPETAELLESGLLTTLADSRYPLIEFPFQDYAREATGILDSVLGLGLRPIVAHPERYDYVQGDPGLINLWTDMGCLLQVNRGSLMGRFGRHPEALSHALVGRGFAAFVASDAHSPGMRTPWLKDVEELLMREYSPGTAQELLTDNPQRVLKNEKIRRKEPVWF